MKASARDPMNDDYIGDDYIGNDSTSDDPTGDDPTGDDSIGDNSTDDDSISDDSINDSSEPDQLYALRSSAEGENFFSLKALLLFINTHAGSQKYAVVLTRTKCSKKDVKRKTFRVTVGLDKTRRGCPNPTYWWGWTPYFVQ
jgi:hypothetical protein